MPSTSPTATKTLPFQSTPPVSGRRCAGYAQDVGRVPQVSIHAPRFREAMPHAPWAAVAHRRVSIHAPRFREAMRCRPPRPDPGWDVSIHAPRFREAMPLGAHTMKCRLACFNPRPPFPGGDAADVDGPDKDGHVSIHAPRFREAMRLGKLQAFITGEFQSTPPVSGRRCEFSPAGGPPAARFNPRPPFPGGDAGWHAGYLDADC
ncbi:MAG: hypothetical protein H6R15_2683 [Proteobacteria bacterium]|nr:hypothetical protein [Pseudomonadota bacterium]